MARQSDGLNTADPLSAANNQRYPPTQNGHR